MPESSRFFILAVPLGLLGVAAIQDVRDRRIPNWLTVSLAITGVMRAVIEGGAWAALGAAGAVALGLAVLFVPFQAGLLGGGDVKLVAAAGAWLGAFGVMKLIVWSAVAGGVLSAAFYLRSTAAERSEVRANVTSVLLLAPGDGVRGLKVRDRGVPYGLAIAAVAAVMLAWRT